MSKSARILLPIGAGLAGAVFLTGLYLGLVSWAESPQHAVDFLWQDRWIVFPIILGFGVQTALYFILRKRLFVPVASVGPSGVMTGASGATSTIAMAACCAHHVTDVLPILGLTAAATFLAEYRTAFMLVGLGTTVVGIAVMLVILFKEQRKAIVMSSLSTVLEAE
jgi:ABC-type multidrug transport system permease subunit